jgi:nitrogen fixation NifU-like protein
VIKDIRYATNGCQDTVVIGSMFTDMIQQKDINYAMDAIKRMNERLGEMTPQQQVCADLVFRAFTASMKNYENVVNGADEELHVYKMTQSCDTINSNGNSMM